MPGGGAYYGAGVVDDPVGEQAGLAGPGCDDDQGLVFHAGDDAPSEVGAAEADGVHGHGQDQAALGAGHADGGTSGHRLGVVVEADQRFAFLLTWRQIALGEQVMRWRLDLSAGTRRCRRRLGFLVRRVRPSGPSGGIRPW
jgi:hypothetical protein